MRKQLLLTIVALLFAASAQAVCTIPLTDSGAQLINDINTCLAVGGGGAPAAGGVGAIQTSNGAGAFVGTNVTGIVKGNGSSAPSAAGSSDYVAPGADINTSGQVTVTHLAAALPTNQGGTGTTSTLGPGLMRGGNPMTASELSGDATTSGSNVTTVGKVNGGSVPASAGSVGTNSSSQFVAGLGIMYPTSQTISGATNVTPNAGNWFETDVLTFAATATVTIQPASSAGQTFNGIVCQNGTGGYTPTIACGGGLSCSGTWPTWTTTLSTCGDFSLYFDTTTHAYITGATSGPL